MKNKYNYTIRANNQGKSDMVELRIKVTSEKEALGKAKKLVDRKYYVVEGVMERI